MTVEIGGPWETPARSYAVEYFKTALAINLLGGAVLGGISLAAPGASIFLAFQVAGAVGLWFLNVYLLFASVGTMCAEMIRDGQ